MFQLFHLNGNYVIRIGTRQDRYVSMCEFSNHAVLSMSDSTIAVSSKYTQDLSVQIVFFTFSCKWFLCFYFWAVIWSYIVDLFAALHELASARARTLLKLASSVRALLKPYGDTLNNIWQRTFHFKDLIAIFWALLANEARFFRFKVFFGASSLQNEVGDPPFFLAFLATVYNNLSALQVLKKSVRGNILSANVLKFCF